MLLQQGLSYFLLTLIIILGFFGAFLDSSMGMGYGLLTPIFLILGLDVFIVVPVLLFSQMTTGFVGSIFHSLYNNVDFRSNETQNIKTTILFIGMGFLGVFLAIILVLNINAIILKFYIGFLMIIAGSLMFPKIKFTYSWKRMVFLNGLASFNKAISGGGYGPIMTIGQMASGRDARKSVAFTDFIEAFLSGFGFLLYLIFNQYIGINVVVAIQMSLIMIISGVVATPLGALVTKRLEEKNIKNIIGILSVSIGIFTLIRLLLVDILNIF